MSRWDMGNVNPKVMTMEREEINIEWPTMEDKLFVPGGHRNLAGHLLNPIADYPAKFRLVAAGYKAAGDKLVGWLETNPRNDALVLPIIFCYRQYVELTLKDIALLVNNVKGNGDSHKQIHNLEDLFVPLKSDLKQFLSEDEQETLEAVEDIVMQFHHIDPDATTFRYLDGCMPFHQIDLGNLRTVVHRLAEFLDSLADHLEAEWAHKQ